MTDWLTVVECHHGIKRTVTTTCVLRVMHVSRTVHVGILAAQEQSANARSRLGTVGSMAAASTAISRQLGCTNVTVALTHQQTCVAVELDGLVRQADGNAFSAALPIDRFGSADSPICLKCPLARVGRGLVCPVVLAICHLDKSILRRLCREAWTWVSRANTPKART